MNYNEIYLNLCKNAKLRFQHCNFMNPRSEKDYIYKTTDFKYLECHHIIPVSDGGLWDQDNLCYLTAREHVIAHHLLFKSNPTKNHFQSFHYQVYCNKSGFKLRLSTKEIEYITKLNSEYCADRIKKSNYTINKLGLRLGKNNSCYGKHWYTNGITNIHLSDLDEIPEGFYKGRTYGKNAYKNSKSTKGRLWYTNGIVNKMFYVTDDIPDGYYRGVTKCKNIH